MRRAVLIALALVASGCSAASVTPTTRIVYITPSPMPSGPAVNGQPISQAKPCDSYVGQVLTKASETMICSDPDGSGDTTSIQPAGTTQCANGETFISVSATVGGIEGQKAAKLKAGYSLDRSTCLVTEP